MGGDLRRWLAAGAVLLVLTASAAQAYFATYYHYAVTRAEYQAQAVLERGVPGRAYLSPGSAFWPVRATEAYAWRLTDDWEYDRPLQNEGDGLRTEDYLIALEAHLKNRSAPTFALYGPRMDGYAVVRRAVEADGVRAPSGFRAGTRRRDAGDAADRRPLPVHGRHPAAS